MQALMNLEEFQEWLESPATRAVFKALKAKASRLEALARDRVYNNPPLTEQDRQRFFQAKAQVEVLDSLAELTGITKEETEETWRDFFETEGDGGSD